MEDPIGDYVDTHIYSLKCHSVYKVPYGMHAEASLPKTLDPGKAESAKCMPICMHANSGQYYGH